MITRPLSLSTQRTTGYTVAMPRKLPIEKTATSSSLWEQWLQKLSVNNWLSPLAERHKLAVIDWIISQYQPNRQFVIRLADRLTTALGAYTAFVYQKNGDRIHLLHSRLPKVVGAALIKEPLFRELLSAKTSAITQQQFEQTFGPSDEPITTHWLINLPVTVNNNPVGIGLLLTEMPHRNDSKFIRLIHRVLRGQQHQHFLIGALASESERLTTLIHHLSEGMVILDSNLQVVQWNRPMQRLSGYSPREAERKPYHQVFERINASLWLQELMAEYRLNPQRNVFFAEFEINTKQQRPCWVSVSGSFLRGSENQIEQTIMIVRDISRQHQLEQRKNEFISIATHELRTPITAIKGYLSLIERADGNLTEKQTHYVRRAVEANDRLVRLAEDLLQVIQVEENRLSFSLRPINLLPITRKVVADFLPNAKKKGLILNLVTPDFPTTVAADPVRIEQVIANLLDNAIKYTPAGTVEVTFSQSVNRDMRESQVTLAVKDTGIGIPDRELPQIFDKFHRCTNVIPSPQSGAGLGLYIVRTFVEKQNGQINVKSRPGRGTTFTLTFASVESNAVSKQRTVATEPLLKRRETHGKKASSTR